MERGHTLVLVCALLLVATGCAAQGEATRAAAAPESVLLRGYDLGGKRVPEPRYYHMETEVVTYAKDGTRAGTVTYRLYLMCTPPTRPERAAYQYTCAKLTIQRGQEPEVSIPALTGWSYEFSRGESGLDEKGQVLGIEHARFEGLTDSKGALLQPDVAYTVYNSFIDFHAFCNVFAEPAPDGGGIQDLKMIGQKIVHAAAHSEAPVNLGSNIAEGSYYKNGEVTLEFKGLSVVDGVPCAIIAYDSGEGAFKMLTEPMLGMQVTTVGASHYFGDLYVELDSKWVRKATMGEMVVAEATMDEETLADFAVERALTIRAVTEEAFAKPARES